MIRSKKIFKRTAAMLLSILMILSTFTCLSSFVASAAQVGNDIDIEKELSQYGDVITNEELGEIVSYSGYITKAEYAEMLAEQNDGSVSATVHPTFDWCYDTSGNKITVVKAMCNHSVGAYMYRIKVNGENVYCIEPGQPLRSVSSLNESSDTWSNLSPAKQKAISLALACGFEGNASTIKTGTINDDQAYAATQVIVWEIVKGQRSTSSPYALNSGKSGYIDMFCYGGKNANIKKAYNNIVSAMKTYMTIPSFTSSSSSSAPTITLTANYYEGSDTWTYSSVTKTDSNKVLDSYFSGLASTSGKTYDLGNAKVLVTRSGNKITFKVTSANTTKTGTTQSLSCEKSGVPTGSNGKVIAYGGSDIQDVVTAKSVTPPTAYLNIKVEVTSHDITRDGQIMKSAYTPSEWADNSVKEGEGSLSTSENVEGYYFYVSVSSDFKEYYGVDHIILGPTDKMGLTQTLSDYVSTYLDKNVSNNIPQGNYYVWELGKLKSGYKISDIIKAGYTGETLANYFYYPDNWAVADDANYRDGYTGASASRFTLRITAEAGDVFSTCYASNIYYFPIELQKTCEDGSSAEGYYFQMVNNDTGTTYRIGPTDEDGYASMGTFTYTTGDVTKYFEEGTYTVTELGKKNDDGTYSIPTGYVTPDSIEVEVSAEAYLAAQENGYSTIHMEFVNRCEGYIAIQKSDSVTGEALAGAVYGVYTDGTAGSAESDGDGLSNLIDVLTTDENGYAQSEYPYSCDTYYIQEITAPDGYVLDDTVYEVNVVASEVVKNNIVLTNVTDEATETYITKTDATGDNELEGAELKLTDSEGNVIKEWTSTTEAELIYGLIAGEEYTLTETIAPDGYATTNSITFTINEDGTATQIIMKDDTIKVQFNKVDEDGNLVAGAVLQVLDTNGNIIDEWTTDGTSNHTIEGKLVSGKTYVLHEETAPSGYTIADNVTFTVKDTASVQIVSMTNKQTETYITKTDATGENELAGAKLKLTDSEGNVIDEWTSTTEAHKIYGLIAGDKYTLTETLAPNGYATTSSITFTVNEDGTPTKVLMKDDTTKVQFNKVDEDGNLVEGAVLQVLDTDGNVIDEWTTTSKSSHTIEGKLVVGKTYILHEKAAPDGYSYANDIQFTVKDTASVQSLTMTDEATKVYIDKIDEDGNSIKGAVLEILDSDGNSLVKWTSTGEPYEITGILNADETYTLHEISAPAGKVVADDVTFTVPAYAEAIKVQMTDADTNITIIKVDENGETLSGAVMQIIDSKGNVVKEWTTSNEALLLKGELVAGETYTLHEVSAPAGYGVAEDQTFTVNTDTTMLTITMVDNYSSASILKVDEENNPVVGAVLQILDSEGNVIDEWTSEEEAHIVTGKLTIGETYILHEETTPDGYATSEDVTFISTSSDSLSPDEVTMVDGTIKYQFNKVDENGEALSGAVLQILDSEGNIVAEWTTTDTAYELDGVLVAEKTYTLHEVSAPNGYLVADDIEFTVENTSEVQVVSMTDESTKYQFNKVDESGNPLTGAVLQILDSEENIVAEWTTDGTAYELISTLTVGETYTLHEVSAPNGYLVADDIEFTVEDISEVQIVSMTDESTKYQFNKVDESGNPLAGAVLQILDSEENIVAEWTTDGTAYELISTLTVGETYTLHEVSAPNGYYTAEDITFTVEDTSEVQKVTMTDVATKYQFNKVDENGEALSGAVLQILDEDGNIVAEWTTDGTAYELIGVLAVGKTYTLHEVSAPDGYEIADDITFTVDETSVGETQTVTMTDEYTGEVSIATPDQATMDEATENGGYIQTGSYVFGGIFAVLIAAAAIFYLFSRKKENSAE